MPCETVFVLRDCMLRMLNIQQMIMKNAKKLLDQLKMTTTSERHNEL